MSEASELHSDRNYTVRTKINKPVAEVFAAIVSSEHATKYFVNKTSGDMVEGTKVDWTSDEYGTNEVTIKKVVANELIQLGLDSENWQKTNDDSYEVLVSFEFEVLDENSTMVSISESGWRHDAEGYKGSHDNCGGWQDFLLCLKGYLEYGIDLRK